MFEKKWYVQEAVIDCAAQVEQALQALADGKIDGSPESMLQALLLFYVEQNASSIEYPRVVTNHILTTALERLALHDPIATEILHRYYWQHHSDGQIANNAGFDMSRPTILRRRHQAIAQLADVIKLWEMDVRSQWRTQQIAQLPTAQQIVGREQQIKEVVDLLRKKECDVATLVGMGGIGKTVLARAIVKRLIDQFAIGHILWLSVPAISVAALPNWIHEQVIQLPSNRQSLVIIDGIEQSAESAAITPYFIGATFLMTSRVQPRIGITIPVNPLNRTDTVTLLKRDVPEALVERLGGHPHAIQIARALLETMPAERVLARLGAAENPLHMRLFTLAWALLSPAARRLLHALRLTSSTGATDDHLLAFSTTDLDETYAALYQLQILSLVTRQQQRRVVIHPLTDAFLATQATDTFADSIGRNLNFLRMNHKKIEYSQLARGIRFGLQFESEGVVALIVELFHHVETSFAWRDWLSILENAILCPPTSDRKLQQRLHSQLGWLYRRDEQLDAARKAHYVALKLAKNPHYQAREWLNLSVMARYANDYVSAIEQARNAIELFTAHAPKPRYLAPAYNTLGLALYRNVEFEKAAEAFIVSSRHFKQIDSQSGWVRVQNNIANCYRELGETKRAEEILVNAVMHATHDLDNALLKYSLAELHVLQGEAQAAQTLLPETVSSLFAMREQGRLWRIFGRIYQLNNQIDQATNAFQASISAWRETQDNAGLLESLLLLAHVASFPLADDAWREANQLRQQNANDRWLQWVWCKLTSYKPTFSKKVGFSTKGQSTQ